MEHRKPISFRFPHHVYEHAHHLLQVQCSPLSALTHQTNSPGHRSKATKSFMRSSKNISHNGPRSASSTAGWEALLGSQQFSSFNFLGKGEWIFVPMLVLQHIVDHPKPQIHQPPSSPVALVMTPLIELGNVHVSNLAKAKALFQIDCLGPCSITEWLLVLSSMLHYDIMGTNNAHDVEKGFIFNWDDSRNPATKGSAKQNKPYIITNWLSFVILRSVQETRSAMHLPLSAFGSTPYPLPHENNVHQSLIWHLLPRSIRRSGSWSHPNMQVGILFGIHRLSLAFSLHLPAPVTSLPVPMTCLHHMHWLNIYIEWHKDFNLLTAEKSWHTDD